MKKIILCLIAGAWFCLCLTLSAYVSEPQNGIRLASSIFFTIDDELRGLLPYCGLKHPQLLFHVNPRFLFGAVQAMLTNVYVHTLYLDVLTAFRFTNVIFSSLTVFFMCKIADALNLKTPGRVLCLFLFLSSPLFLFFSVSGFEAVFCAFLVTLFFYLYLRQSTLSACFVLGLAPLVRLETLAVCAVVALLCFKEKKFFAAAIPFLPFALFTAGTKLFLGLNTDKTVYDILVPANFPQREIKDILLGYANLWNSFGGIFWLTFFVFTVTTAVKKGFAREFEKLFLLTAAALLAILTASYFYSSVYSLCGRYWLTLFPAQCLFLSSVWQNDIEGTLKKKQRQNLWVWIFPLALYAAYFYSMSITHGLPPQNSDNQYTREPRVTKSSFVQVRAWLNDELKKHPVKTLYFTWEFYDTEIFVENKCRIFDEHRVLWGPTPEGWAYWTKIPDIQTHPCSTPYLDFTTMKTLQGLPEEPFLLVTTSRWFQEKCPMKLKKVFPGTDIKVYTNTANVEKINKEQ